MRTTLEIDDSVIAAAKAIARDEGLSLGAVISTLALTGLRSAGVARSASGFPVFSPAHDARPITLDLVNEHRDD